MSEARVDKTAATRVGSPGTLTGDDCPVALAIAVFDRGKQCPAAESAGVLGPRPPLSLDISIVACQSSPSMIQNAIPLYGMEGLGLVEA
jgi:hypothetical protein